MIWSAIIGQIVEYWPWLIGLMALFGVHAHGKAAQRATDRAEAMKRMIRRSENRLEIEDAIDQDTDLVSRAHAAGVVSDAKR